MSFFFSPVSFMFFVACSSSEEDFSFSPKEKDTKTSEDEIDTATVHRELFFYSDVRPVIDRACIHCHYEGGRSFDMNSHESVVALSEYIARDVRDGGKPPPLSSKNCRPYVGDHHFVMEEDKVVFEQWYEQGSPIGDPEDASDYIPPQQHEQPEQEFDFLIAVSPNYPFPNNEGHKCTIIELGNSEDIALLSSEFYTNEIRKNWSSMLFLAPSDFEGTHGDVFDCNYGGRQDWDVLASWSPGKGQIEYGDGIVLEPNTKIIFKQFWFPENQSFEGLIAYWGLKTTSEIPEQPTEIVKLEIENFRLQAEEAQLNIQDDFLWTMGSKTILGGFVRSSLLSKGLEISKHSNGVEDCLLQYQLYEPLVPQHVMFREPLEIENNDEISISCKFDNSSGNLAQFNQPPQDVQQGYQSNEALCFVTLYVQ